RAPLLPRGAQPLPRVPLGGARGLPPGPRPTRVTADSGRSSTAWPPSAASAARGYSASSRRRTRQAWLEEAEGEECKHREASDFLRYRDGRGPVADFHALRYTFCPLLARQYPIEVVSKLMRHSGIQLTSDV